MLGMARPVLVMFGSSVDDARPSFPIGQRPSTAVSTKPESVIRRHSAGRVTFVI